MADEKPMEAKEMHKEETTTTTTSSNMPTESAKGGNGALKVIVIVVVILLLCCVCSIIAFFAFSGYVASNANSVSTDLNKALNDAAKNAIQKNTGNSTGTPATGNTGSSLDGFSGSDANGSYSFGGTLPSGFPTDVPVYSNSKVGFTSSTKNTNGKDEFTATFTSSAKVADVVGFYKSQLPSNGWNITSEQSFFGSSITAEKSGREVTVVVLGDDSSGSDLTFTLSVTYK